MDNYEIISTLGVGSFGTVFKAKSKLTNEIVAIKKFNKNYYSKDKCKELREVKSLTKLDNKNIIKLLDLILEDNTLYLVFELMQQNIYELISQVKSSRERKSFKGLKEKEVKSIIFQTLSGLSYMHKMGYFHRDLKPENILIDKSFIIKLADFGLAREIRSVPPYTQYVSTRWYRAPECLFESTNYSYPIDIWAVGCITFELLSGNPLFPGSNQRDTLMKITSLLGPPIKSGEIDKLSKKINYKFPTISSMGKASLNALLPDNISNEAIDFLNLILQWEPNCRPTANNLLLHAFFSNMEIEDDCCFEVSEKIVKSNGFDIDKLLDNSQEFKKFMNKINQNNSSSPIPNLEISPLLPIKKEEDDLFSLHQLQDKYNTANCNISSKDLIKNEGGNTFSTIPQFDATPKLVRINENEEKDEDKIFINNMKQKMNEIQVKIKKQEDVLDTDEKTRKDKRRKQLLSRSPNKIKNEEEFSFEEEKLVMSNKKSNSNCINNNDDNVNLTNDTNKTIITHRKIEYESKSGGQSAQSRKKIPISVKKISFERLPKNTYEHNFTTVETNIRPISTFADKKNTKNFINNLEEIKEDSSIDNLLAFYPSRRKDKVLKPINQKIISRNNEATIINNKSSLNINNQNLPKRPLSIITLNKNQAPLADSELISIPANKYSDELADKLNDCNVYLKHPKYNNQSAHYLSKVRTKSAFKPKEEQKQQQIIHMTPILNKDVYLNHMPSIHTIDYNKPMQNKIGIRRVLNKPQHQLYNQYNSSNTNHLINFPQLANNIVPIMPLVIKNTPTPIIQESRRHKLKLKSIHDINNYQVNTEAALKEHPKKLSKHIENSLKDYKNTDFNSNFDDIQNQLINNIQAKISYFN